MRMRIDARQVAFDELLPLMGDLDFGDPTAACRRDDQARGHDGAHAEKMNAGPGKPAPGLATCGLDARPDFGAETGIHLRVRRMALTEQAPECLVLRMGFHGNVVTHNTPHPPKTLKLAEKIRGFCPSAG